MDDKIMTFEGKLTLSDYFDIKNLQIIYKMPNVNLCLLIQTQSSDSFGLSDGASAFDQIKLQDQDSRPDSPLAISTNDGKLGYNWL